MIAALIRWSVANRFLVLIATALLVAAALFSMAHTPVDALPDLSDTQVIVRTTYAGKPPQVVEDLVRRMNSIEGTSDRTYRLTLLESEIGGTVRQRATLRCLGLRRRGSSAVVSDTPQMRGRIRAVAHLLSVEES